MKNKLTLLPFILLLGCTPKVTEETLPTNIMPSELKDCKFYNIYDGMTSIRVVRCPNSSTSATWRAGKQAHYSSTIDG